MDYSDHPAYRLGQFVRSARLKSLANSTLKAFCKRYNANPVLISNFELGHVLPMPAHQVIRSFKNDQLYNFYACNEGFFTLLEAAWKSGPLPEYTEEEITEKWLPVLIPSTIDRVSLLDHITENAQIRGYFKDTTKFEIFKEVEK